MRVRHALPYRDDDARVSIRRLVEDWVLFRDAGDWDSFTAVWHDDGRMTATWFEGKAADFIEASRKAFESGWNILHLLGGHTSRVRENRAVGQTRMTIQQRAEIDGVVVDVTCTGRFYDFFERRAGWWGIVRRQPIYETDRLDLVDPAASLALDPQTLGEFPEGYRHLAYLQSRLGSQVTNGLPGLRGPEVELLYAEGAQWLAGSPAAGVPLSLATALPTRAT